MEEAIEKAIEEESREQCAVERKRTCGRRGDAVRRQFPLQLLGALQQSFHRSYLPPAAEALASSGWVTMEIFVMPACLTASMTLAKAPKGTFSSARR